MKDFVLIFSVISYLKCKKLIFKLYLVSKEV